MNWILKTKRLKLREFDISDAPAFFELNLDPEVMRYTGDLAFNSVEASAELIQNYDHYVKHGFGRWTVVTQKQERVIGWCGLKQHDEGFVDIGFRLFRNEWGKGYATEAAKACLEYGLMQLSITNIIGRASLENTASLHVLEKIGMKFWKHAPCEGIENSVYYKLVSHT